MKEIEDSENKVPEMPPKPVVTSTVVKKTPSAVNEKLNESKPLNSSTDLYKCPYDNCGKTYGTESNMNNHIRYFLSNNKFLANAMMAVEKLIGFNMYFVLGRR